MKIAKLDVLTLKIPFDDLYDGPRAKRRGWTEFDTLLVRVEDAEGNVGWGEAFAYSCAGAVRAALLDMVAPLVLGREIQDIPALNRELQLALHIWGRYGITIFALSGLDIALWDLQAKRAGLCLARHLGGRNREQVPAYASLVRYAGAAPITTMIQRARTEGYGDIKLHEIDPLVIEAARAAGPDLRLTVDVNCAWSHSEAETLLARLRPLNLHWVEEPIFPPEDYDTHQALARFGVPLAAGENACTAFEFRRLIPALDYPQPSVTKIGGISEFLATLDLAEAAGKSAMPHSPYFGPGYWATLQLAANRPSIGLFEFLYVQPAAWLAPDIPLPRQGMIQIPDSPGLGFTPDPAILEQYRVN